MTAARDGREIDLTPREFKIMKFFIDHRGEVVTRDQLLDGGWGYESLPLSRTVDSHIAKLRRPVLSAPPE